MKPKKIIALSSAIIIGTTTILTGMPNTVFAQETAESATEVVKQENLTEAENILTDPNLSDSNVQQPATPQDSTLETDSDTSVVIPPTVTEDNQTDVDVKDEGNPDAQKEEILDNKVENEDIQKNEVQKEEPQKNEALDNEVQKEESQKEETDKTDSKIDGIPIDESHFPDPIFKAFVEKTADLNKNGYLSQDEISKQTSLTFWNSHLENIKGIEYFTALESLDIYGSRIKTLDLTGLDHLSSLFIRNNFSLTTLSLALPNLKNLNCSYNALTSLVLKTPRLVNLSCSNNHLETLDVSNHKNLETVEYSNNTELKTLDFRGCFNLVSAHHSVQQETVYISAGMVKYVGCNLFKEHTGNMIIDLDNFYTINPDNSKSVDLDTIISPTLISVLEAENHPCFNKETHVLTIPATDQKTVLKAGFDDSYTPTYWTFFTDITAVDDCTIKFDSMGGSPVEDLIIQKDSTATEPTNPTKDGYYFKGWYLDKEYSNAYDFSTPVNNDFILYARWEKEPVKNTPPTINATDKILTVGDFFDPLKDVSASDKEDGSITLTKDHIIANDVNTTKVGTYHVTYKVADSHKVSTEKTIAVTVKEGPIPKKQDKTSKTPLTGDMTNLNLFISMFAGSSGLLAGLCNKKRKRK